MRVTFDERPTIMPDSYCEDEHDAREGSYIPPLEVVSEPPLGTAGPPPRPVAKVEPLVSVDTVRKASGGAAQVSRDPNLVDIDMNWKPGLATNSIFFCFLFVKNHSFAWRGNQ